MSKTESGETMKRHAIEWIGLGTGSIAVALTTLSGILVILFGVYIMLTSSELRIGIWAMLLGLIILALPALFYGVGKFVGEVLG